MPPRAFGLSRNPVPHFPDSNIRLGLSRTGALEPRSWSLSHQLAFQSWGTKASWCARVTGASRTIASFSNAGVPLELALQPEPVPLPVETKTLPVLSSITTPPADQMPMPCPGVRYGVPTTPPVLVETAK